MKAFNCVPEVSRPFSCWNCKEGFVYEKDAAWHTLKGCLAKCRYCPYKSRKKKTLRAHIRCHEIEFGYKCQFCGFMSISKSHQRWHLKTAHSITEWFYFDFLRSDLAQLMRVDRVFLKCEIQKFRNVALCLLYFSYDLTRDVQLNLAFFFSDRLGSNESVFIDSGIPRRLTCERCGKGYARQGNLIHHLQNICGGSNNRPFTCRRCGRSFKSKKVLESHMRDRCRNHPVKCPHCPYSTTRDDRLKTHISYHGTYFGY